MHKGCRNFVFFLFYGDQSPNLGAHRWQNHQKIGVSHQKSAKNSNIGLLTVWNYIHRSPGLKNKNNKAYSGH